MSTSHPAQGFPPRRLEWERVREGPMSVPQGCIEVIARWMRLSAQRELQVALPLLGAGFSRSADHGADDRCVPPQREECRLRCP